MSVLTIPESALKDSGSFKSWCETVHDELFGDSLITRKSTRRFPISNKTQSLQLINLIMGKVNLILFNDPTVPVISKTKKFPTKTGDVIAVTAYLIVEQYDVKLSHLAKVMNLNHSSIIYYKKKVDAIFFREKDKFVKKYATILTALINTGILFNIKMPRPEVLQYIKDKELFMSQFQPV